MNKKNITLILVGIMLLILQLNIRVGNTYIDIFSDLVGAILIAIGGFPISKRNLVFKKMRGIMILGIILSIFSLAFGYLVGIKGNQYTTQIVTGCATITLIYFTYYFSEGLMLEAKFQEKEAATRSFRKIWFLLGALIFASFMTTMSNISMLVIITQALTAIFAIYYCSAVLTACKQLYMEGLPTKHMDTSNL
ncbi:MAG: hypothetical protein IJB96_05745 [Lachnospira sp.]|nr:hypothetical protein [Lachnospira sp.]